MICTTSISQDMQKLKHSLIKWRIGVYVPNNFSAVDKVACDRLGVKVSSSQLLIGTLYISSFVIVAGLVMAE